MDPAGQLSWTQYNENLAAADEHDNHIMLETVDTVTPGADVNGPWVVLT